MTADNTFGGQKNSSSEVDDWLPCYIWPNPQIPFRLYYESDRCRIFLIENIQHNYIWLRDYRPGIRSSDHFFVMLGTWYHEALVAEASRSLEKLKLPKEQFHILFNDDRDRDLFEKFGFSGAIVNHNSFLDETRFFCNEQIKKSFDCIYVGRLANFKRHNLCSELDTLALVCGELNGAESRNYIPPHTYKNSQALTEVEVCEKINESKSGLILSATEGACFASSEYLLCGIPVISTASEGGRAIWYDEYNSLIVEANPLAVKDAVQFFVKNPRNPNVIRNAHIALSRVHRSNFIKLFSQVLECCGQDVRDPVRYFAESFFHKMRGYIKPEFSVLFRY